MMTHRERVLTALDHRVPDRVPLDIAGTFASTLNRHAYEALRAYLGLEPRPTKLASRRSQTASVEEDVLTRLDVDCRQMVTGGPEHRPDRELPDGSYLDNWGVTWVKPSQGHYYVKDPVFTGDLTPEVLSRHTWPDPSDPGYVRGLRERAQELHEMTDYAVVLCLPVGFVHQMQFLRGYDAWLVDLLSDPKGFAALADAVLDVWLEISRRMIEACWPHIDLVFYGDDIAFQNGPMMHPRVFHSLVKPRLKRVFDMIKSQCGAKNVYHSCGSVVSLIPDLIEVGVDCLNPVQVSAAGMDLAVLKKQFGKDLCFWGGIDTQHILPFGTPSAVREAVKRTVGILGVDGGYVVASVHNIQAEVPPENIVAMVEAAHAL